MGLIFDIKDLKFFNLFFYLSWALQTEHCQLFFHHIQFHFQVIDDEILSVRRVFAHIKLE